MNKWAVENGFSGTTVFCSDLEPFEITLKRFTKLIEKEGLLKEYKDRQVYIKPSEKARRKRMAAIRRSRSVEL